MECQFHLSAVLADVALLEASIDVECQFHLSAVLADVASLQFWNELLALLALGFGTCTWICIRYGSGLSKRIFELLIKWQAISLSIYLSIYLSLSLSLSSPSPPPSLSPSIYLIYLLHLSLFWLHTSTSFLATYIHVFILYVFMHKHLFSAVLADVALLEASTDLECQFHLSAVLAEKGFAGVFVVVEM